MKTTTEILDILCDFKAHYAEKYGIITLGLFGSAARGEHDETSDIDICIKLQEPDYFTIQDIKEDLEKIIDMLHFVEEQSSFIERTTKHLKSYHDFLTSDSAMVLFNSTC